jgi:hypothetical protein
MASGTRLGDGHVKPPLVAKAFLAMWVHDQTWQRELVSPIASVESLDDGDQVPPDTAKARRAGGTIGWEGLSKAPVRLLAYSPA